MPLFFFLSGLTAKEWTHGAGLRPLRGLKSLLVPYVFFSLISIDCWAILKGYTSTSDTLTSQLWQMGYGVAGPKESMHYNIPLWFFTCLISVRLLFAVLTATVASNAVRCVCVVMTALIAHYFVFARFESMIWNFDVALVALVFFFAGHAVQNLNLSAVRGNVASRVVVRVGALLLFVLAIKGNGRVDMNGRSFGNPLLFYVGAFAGITLMVEIAKKLDRIAAIKTLGRASIVIFPVHALFWLLPSRFFSVISWYATKVTDSEVFVSFVVSVMEIAACLFSYFVLTKWAPSLIGQKTRAQPRTLEKGASVSA